MPSHVRPTPLTDDLYEYVLRVGVREPDVLRRLREETARLPDGEWQTAPEQGPFLDLLVKLLGAKEVLEIGTFTGYGTLWLALAVPPGGRVTTCDIRESFPAVGKPYWAEAGVADRIDLRVGDAVTTTAELLAAGRRFDLVFVDADKENVGRYYETGLALLRPGGVIAIDNTLWDGRPADAGNAEASTVAIRALNAKLFADERIDLSFLPFADGLTLGRKR